MVGYNGVPRLTPNCTNDQCRKGPDGFIAVNYYFPGWMLSRVLATVIRFTDIERPEAGLTAIDIAEKRQVAPTEKSDIDDSWVHAFTLLLEHVAESVYGPPPAYKDVEDQATDYSRTSTTSRGSSVYQDAKQHLSPISPRVPAHFTDDLRRCDSPRSCMTDESLRNEGIGVADFEKGKA
ncbi:hypothetical protein C1H76_1147 [Elsinoe australis]|uniref:Uncharacterized protein n=1 Tax=Elsinoe australis TaxID=40998 RepID=A0A4U7B9I8_9PEZI|nr:hypothetical protein C1H76_1147 [Elsinoe australis]